METNKPMGVVVMGVSGSGKSSLAAELARAEGWDFLEGDRMHPPANVARMRAGIPLTDADRRPWLEHLAASIAQHLREGRSVVVACSALRRGYRDRLRQAGPTLRFVYLQVPREELARRMQARQHFMPVSLLDSQLATLEEPAADEHALYLTSRHSPIDALATVRRWLVESASAD